MKFPTTVGFEYTYLPNPVQRAWWNKFKYSKANQGELMPDYMGNMIRGLKYHNFHKYFQGQYDLDAGLDCGAIEINSPVHKDLKSTKDFYNRMDGVAKKYSLTSHRSWKRGLDTIVEGTGSCHIHMGLPKKSQRFKSNFAYNFLIDVTNRPYLNWIFQEWMEIDDSSNLILRNTHMHFNYLTNRNEPSNYRLIDIDYAYTSHDVHTSYESKANALSFHTTYKTVELRFFDATRDWSQVKDHLDFALAYWKYIYKKTKRGGKTRLIFDDPREMKKHYTKKQCIKEFNAFLKVLKLSPKRYEKYVKTNLKDRFKYGTPT